MTPYLRSKQSLDREKVRSGGLSSRRPGDIPRQTGACECAGTTGTEKAPGTSSGGVATYISSRRRRPPPSTGWTLTGSHDDSPARGPGDWHPYSESYARIPRYHRLLDGCFDYRTCGNTSANTRDLPDRENNLGKLQWLTVLVSSWQALAVQKTGEPGGSCDPAASRVC